MIDNYHAQRLRGQVVARLQHADDPLLEERRLFEGVEPDSPGT